MDNVVCQYLFLNNGLIVLLLNVNIDNTLKTIPFDTSIENLSYARHCTMDNHRNTKKMSTLIAHIIF